MCFNEKGDVSSLNGRSLKLVDKFTYLGSSVSSTEKDINMQLAKTSIGYQSYGSQTWLIKWNAIFTKQQSCRYCIYRCTTWTLTKHIEKKLDDNYTRILQAILKKSWRQHPTKQQLYGHLPPITKTIQVRRTRHVRHCWRSKDKLISDILLWTPSHGWAKARQPARTYIQLLCANTGYSLEDFLGAMDDGDREQEKIREIRAGSATWW